MNTKTSCIWGLRWLDKFFILHVLYDYVSLHLRRLHCDWWWEMDIVNRRVEVDVSYVGSNQEKNHQDSKLRNYSEVEVFCVSYVTPQLPVSRTEQRARQ